MSTSLLATKLYFPKPRSNMVIRPRLVRILEKGLCGPLTLISAPAGSGKTTLMGEWRANSGSEIPVAWLSLDSADNDPLLPCFNLPSLHQLRPLPTLCLKHWARSQANSSSR